MAQNERPNLLLGMAHIHVVQVCTEDEAVQWRRLWRDVYARQGRGAGLHRYLWHVFSAQRYAALNGEEADAAYAEHAAPEYVVLANDASAAVVSDTRPKRDQYLDVYVFQPNLAWTMAFTHEDGYLGPYFATHPDYERLQGENLQRLDKRRQVENAKRRGWA